MYPSIKKISPIFFRYMSIDIKKSRSIYSIGKNVSSWNKTYLVLNTSESMISHIRLVDNMGCLLNYHNNFLSLKISKIPLCKFYW